VRQNVRIVELQRVIEHRYGATLPNDGNGYNAAFVMACHLAVLPNAEARIAHWVEENAPWLTGDGLARLIDRATSRRTVWKADALADRIGLNYETRQRLGITTIGATDFRKRQRTALRKKKARERQQAKRAAAGVKPRTMSLEQSKPWKALRISERTYYRRRKNGSDGSNSCAPPALQVLVERP
jgi:hypothetical protein